jgi:hypothetical protein
VRGEVADHGVHVEIAALLDEPLGGSAQRRLVDVQRHVASQGALGAHGIEQHTRLVGDSRPELDQCVCGGGGGDLGGVCGKETPLGPRQVVLGQSGDLVEEVAAALVVEPDR